jgi:hypothetical protein
VTPPGARPLPGATQDLPASRAAPRRARRPTRLPGARIRPRPRAPRPGRLGVSAPTSPLLPSTASRPRPPSGAGGRICPRVSPGRALGSPVRHPASRVRPRGSRARRRDSLALRPGSPLRRRAAPEALQPDRRRPRPPHLLPAPRAPRRGSPAPAPRARPANRPVRPSAPMADTEVLLRSPLTNPRQPRFGGDARGQTTSSKAGAPPARRSPRHGQAAVSTGLRPRRLGRCGC